MTYKCTECGDEIDTQNGRYGHFRFTDGNGHGPKGEVPDNYTELFEEIESGGDGSEESEPEGSTEGNGSAGDSGGDSSGGGSESSSGSPGSQEGSGGAGESDSGSLGSKLREALEKDVRELFGGGA